MAVRASAALTSMRIGTVKPDSSKSCTEDASSVRSWSGSSNTIWKLVRAAIADPGAGSICRTRGPRVSGGAGRVSKASDTPALPRRAPARIGFPPTSVTVLSTTRLYRFPYSSASDTTSRLRPSWLTRTLVGTGLPSRSTSRTERGETVLGLTGFVSRSVIAALGSSSEPGQADM